MVRLQRRLGKLATARDELSRVPRLVQRYKEAILVAAFCGDLTHDWRLIKKSDESVDLCAEVAELRSESLKAAGTKEKSPVTASWKPVIQLPMRWRWMSVDQLASLVQYGSSARRRRTETMGSRSSEWETSSMAVLITATSSTFRPTTKNSPSCCFSRVTSFSIEQTVLISWGKRRSFPVRAGRPRSRRTLFD